MFWSDDWVEVGIVDQRRDSVQVVPLGFADRNHAATGQLQHVLLGGAGREVRRRLLRRVARAPDRQSPSSSGRYDETTMTASPLPGQLVDDVVELALGADVDALGGLVEHDHLGFGQQPAGQQHLLLIAAGQGGHRLVVGSGAQSQAVQELVRGSAACSFRAADPFGSRLRRLAMVTFSRIDSSGSSPRTLRSSVSSATPAFIMLRGPVGFDRSRRRS